MKKSVMQFRDQESGIRNTVTSWLDPQSGFSAVPAKKDQALPVLFLETPTGKK
jgi:hypothetical protein